MIIYYKGVNGQPLTIEPKKLIDKKENFLFYEMENGKMACLNLDFVIEIEFLGKSEEENKENLKFF